MMIGARRGEYDRVTDLHAKEESAASVHKRRVRYKGRYPRRFQDKYKELNPEKYADTVAHVLGKGSTPAGMHVPILVHEILDILKIQPGERGMDATLGYGGHTEAMLEQLQHRGHIYATDVDPIESEKTRLRLEKKGYGADILSVRQMNFAAIDALAAEVGPFDFILADLGVSSMQIDNPLRGFSYKSDGPLDLRMNPARGISAAERLQQMPPDAIEAMLRENADEPFAHEIARQIAAEQARGVSIQTTAKLHAAVEKALQPLVSAAELREAVRKSSARTFQALRIDVNHEYEVLYDFLAKLPGALAPGGRVVILTFHSGEDRLVKKAFKEFHREGLYQAVARDVIRPSAAECSRNSRAHSTKLRWAVRS